AGTLARLVSLWLRDPQVRAHSKGRPSPRKLMRFDTCHSAAKGLALVDPVRGLHFAALMLSLARRSGAAERFALALASVGVGLVPVGGSMGRWATRMIGRARAIAETTQDPYLLGFTAITTAQIRMLEARWKEMLAQCDAATELLRSRCRGVAWEITIGR